MDPNEEMIQFIKDRNEALLSLDEEKIRSYCEKYGVRFLPRPVTEQEVFWRAVHKAITGCAGLPIEFRRKSKAWLEERGSESMDDGDL